VSELPLPDCLQGLWEHLLILTYGADLVFFEGALWRQMRESCRNRIILADGQQYLKACADYARMGMVRHLNQRYVAEGIFSPRAAHAKLILLANAECGRLLVGSGNLGLDGYAAGGELFTQYDFSPDAPEWLGAFVAVREVTELLKHRGYIGPLASERLDYLWEHIPWIFRPVLTGERPVRHNLDTSFLEQMRQAVGGEPVDELWILAPFYDNEAVALERLLKTLGPRLATILVQPGRTSANRVALERVLHCLPGRCQVRLYSKSAEDPYVHAKLYLAKLRKRAVCLQGSPNLSQVAMLLTDPCGNIEVANLLSGPRDGFDGLLAALDIGPPLDDLEGIDLVVPGQGADDSAEGWQLIGGEWTEGTLRLRYRGLLPDLRGATLLIGDVTLPIEGYALEPQCIVLRLSSNMARLLEAAAPVSICLGSNEEAVSNPIFPCNRASLDAVLQVPTIGITPPHIRDLELDDDELSQLLAELDSALVIDRRSVWQLAGQPPPNTEGEDGDEALRVDYADIDYERLRQHPRIQQYIRGRMGKGPSAQTRLQLILNAITDHFQGLLDPAHTLEAVAQAIAEVSKESDQDEDAEDEGEGGSGHGGPSGQRTLAQRTRRALRGFIRRYLRGVQSRDFREVAGFHVMALNYAIFSYLLWRLMGKDWVEPEFLLDALLRMWAFFWGDHTHRAYYDELREEEQADLVALAAEYQADAIQIAALYQGAIWTRSEGHEAQRLALRDFSRHLLCRPPRLMMPEVLERASLLAEQFNRYDPPLPSEMAGALATLAQYDTRRTFLYAVEASHGYRDGSCTFERVPVAARRQPVTVLVLQADDAMKDMESGLLRDWMRFEGLDYYRIAVPDADGKRRMLFYDVLRSEGVYWDRQAGGAPQDFGPVSASQVAWGIGLERLRRLAAEADARVLETRAGRCRLAS